MATSFRLLQAAHKNLWLKTCGRTFNANNRGFELLFLLLQLILD